MCPVHIPPDLPEASPTIVSMTEDHIVLAISLSRSSLAEPHMWEFLERLLHYSVTTGSPDLGEPR
jgi:hypothetical protein